MTKVDVYVMGQRRGQIEVGDESIIGRLLAGDPTGAAARARDLQVELNAMATDIDAEIRYQVALRVVEEIGTALEYGRRYVTRDGRRLWTVNEVAGAIVGGEIDLTTAVSPSPQPSPAGRGGRRSGDAG